MKLKDIFPINPKNTTVICEGCGFAFAICNTSVSNVETGNRMCFGCSGK